MSDIPRIIARARSYGNTKRGPFTLRFFTGQEAIRVEIQDRDQTVDAKVSATELNQPHDQAVARVCEVIEILIHKMREIREGPPHG